MKILYFINHITNNGGIERIVFDKINYLKTIFNYEVGIAYFGNINDKTFFTLADGIQRYAIKDVPVGHSFFKKIGYSYSVRQQVITIINEFVPDIIVNANTPIVTWLLPFIKKSIPKIIELHFSYNGLLIMNQEIYGSNILKSNFNQLLRRSILPLYNKCIVLAKDDIKHWNFKNVEVISNFTKIKFNNRSSISTSKAICVGRLEYQKDHEILIRAWKIVQDKYPEWKLDIWGNGTLYNELQNLIEELGLSESVKLKGITSNIEKEYITSSLFILPSRYEGLPLVLIEAMCAGLPAIGFNISGVNDIIENEVNGILIKNRNIEALADAICCMIRNNSNLKKMGKNAVLSTSKFNEDFIMNKWKDLFENIQ